MDDDRPADDPLEFESESRLTPGTGAEDGDDLDVPESFAVDAEATTGDADAATERLRGLVVYLATNLTDEPDAVVVEAERRGQNIHLNLRVPEEELGKVIGRQGRIARAMRTALSIAGSRYDVRATLDIDD